MANTVQARKRVLQNVKRRAHNVALRSRFRTHVKNVLKALAKNDLAAAQAAFKIAEPIIDGSVNKGIIHRNKAARHKSQLAQAIKKLALAPTNPPTSPGTTA